jgi:hypothetical protein
MEEMDAWAGALYGSKHGGYTGCNLQSRSSRDAVRGNSGVFTFAPCDVIASWAAPSVMEL